MYFDSDVRQDGLRDLFERCAASSPTGEAELIRKASILFPNWWQEEEPRLRIERLEGMLAIGAYESAALSLISPHAALILSRADDGSAFATLTIAGHGELSFEGSTMALALLAAQSAALLAIDVAVRPDNDE